MIQAQNRIVAEFTATVQYVFLLLGMGAKWEDYQKHGAHLLYKQNEAMYYDMPRIINLLRRRHLIIMQVCL